MPILIVLLASLLLFALPGLLLAAALRRRGYPPLLSLGLALAGWVAIFSNLAAIIGYRFGLFLVVQLALTLGLAIWAAREGGLQELGAAARRVPAWQWLFYLALAVFFIAPAFVIQVPLDTDAQGFGYLVLTVHLSGSITTLAPFHPDIHYLYSPAYFLIIAFLRDLTGAPIHQVMLGFSHLAAFGVALAAFELGRETAGGTAGHFMALGTALGLGLFTTLLDSAYTNVFGLGLTTTFLTLLFRAYRTSQAADGRWLIPNLAPALALAALPLAHPDSIIHLLLAYVPFFGVVWLAKPRPTWAQFARATLVIPLLALAFTLPWVLRVLPLASGVHVGEHLFADWSYASILLQFHGPIILLLAVVGVVLALRRRSASDVWMLVWLIPIVEFGLDGSLDRWALSAGFDPFQIMYPYGVIWHALILPLAYFAALALDAGARTAVRAGWLPALRRLRSPLAAAAILVGVTAAVFNQPILAASKGRLNITGAYSTSADVQAMLWLKGNTPPDSVILNYPDYESHWAPVIAERNAVYFRPQLFYIDDDGARQMWARLQTAYLDPAAPGSEAAMRDFGVDYILMPQIVSRPDLFRRMMRWRRPDLPAQLSSFDEVDYLKLVADFDGAKVYEVAGQ
jgi:hypothetical protein